MILKRSHNCQIAEALLLDMYFWKRQYSTYKIILVLCYTWSFIEWHWNELPLKVTELSFLKPFKNRINTGRPVMVWFRPNRGQITGQIFTTFDLVRWIHSKFFSKQNTPFYMEVAESEPKELQMTLTDWKKKCFRNAFSFFFPPLSCHVKRVKI